jgi:predicted metalloprotease with PDZ domain
MMKLSKKVQSPFRLLFFLSFIFFIFAGFKSIEEKIEKLRPRRFCINANLENSWKSTLQALQELGIKTTLEDETYHVITTDFVWVDSKRLHGISDNSRPLAGGRFTLKISFEEKTAAFTVMNITTQIRQEKIVGKSEKLLKSRGNFEKFLAARVTQLAIAEQFPGIYEIRLGMQLIPDLKTDLYKIQGVEENSPVGEAGVKDDDVLLEIDGQKISIEGELFDFLNSIQIEKQAAFKIQRKNEVLEKLIWIVRVPENQEKLGIRLIWHKDQREFAVSYIEADSRAEKAGIKIGDIVLEEANLPLTSWTHYYRALAKQKAGIPFEMKVLRNGEKLDFTL